MANQRMKDRDADKKRPYVHLPLASKSDKPGEPMSRNSIVVTTCRWDTTEAPIERHVLVSARGIPSWRTVELTTLTPIPSCRADNALNSRTWSSPTSADMWGHEIGIPTNGLIRIAYDYMAYNSGYAHDESYECTNDYHQSRSTDHWIGYHKYWIL